MAITQQSSVASDTAAYEALAYFQLRPELHYTNMFTVKPTRQTHRGATVSFDTYSELAAATSPLTETSDVTAVAMGDSMTTVTLLEYGNAVQTSAKLRGTSFLEIDADAANLVGYNAGLSIDTVARDVLEAGTNVHYAGAATSTATVAAGHILDAGDVRTVVAKLRGNNARGWFGMNYAGVMHPDVSYDLRSETGTDAFADAAAYSDANRVWNGTIGSFGGVTWMESSRPSIIEDGGVTTTDAYYTLIAGQECGAMAYSRNVSGPMPRIVIGPQTDALRRFNTVGWYQLAGWGRFREAALYRIESSSSIGDNA